MNSCSETAGIDGLKSRAKTVLQFVHESAFYAKTLPLSYDDKAKALLDLAILNSIAEKIDTLSDFTADSIQAACKQVADAKAGGKLGQTARPFRAALTGTTVSPSIFHAAEILGREETLARLQVAARL